MDNPYSNEFYASLLREAKMMVEIYHWVVFPCILLRDRSGKKKFISCIYIDDLKNPYDWSCFLELAKKTNDKFNWFNALALRTDRSGVISVDCDSDDAMKKVLSYCDGVKLCCTISPSGRGHYWFRDPGDIIRGRRKDLAIDVMHLEFVPPSRVYNPFDKSTTEYRWDIMNDKIPEMPDRLKYFLAYDPLKDPEFKKILSGDKPVTTAELLSRLPYPGMRHDTLLSLAGKVKHQTPSMTEDQIYEYISCINEMKNFRKPKKELRDMANFVCKKQCKEKSEFSEIVNKPYLVR